MVLYSNKLVDFTGWAAWTIYGDTQATTDFGQINQPVQGGDRLKVDTSDRLRFSYQQDKWGVPTRAEL